MYVIDFTPTLNFGEAQVSLLDELNNFRLARNRGLGLQSAYIVGFKL